ncbi:MAG: hypothetical protein KDK78_05045 [Chlamydiia bacterium]|nr:hypothetical protein [Chlamydiia bacterium]
MSERPGAVSPWPAINQLLGPSERFCIQSQDGESLLLAPRERARLSALLFELKEHADVSPPRIVTTRALSHIDGTDLADGLLHVEAGATLQDVQNYLLEKGMECAWSDWVWRGNRKTSMASILIRGADGGFGREPESTLIAYDAVLTDGTEVRLSRFQRPLPGSIAFVTRLTLRLRYRPECRIFASWKGSGLEEQLAALQSFSDTWECLDHISSNQDANAFILAQISGTTDEMEAFRRHCPAWSDRLHTDPRPGLLHYVRQFQIEEAAESQSGAGVIWKHYCGGRSWWMHP